MILARFSKILEIVYIDFEHVYDIYFEHISERKNEEFV